MANDFTLDAETPAALPGTSVWLGYGLSRGRALAR